MTDDTHQVPAGLSAAASAEWIGVVDEVLRGVGHSLNNRAAALAAVMELTTEPAERPEVIREILAAEMEKIRALVRVLRGVGTGRDAVEAFSPDEAVADALAVLELHAAMRGGVPPIDVRATEPIRTHRWIFVRAVVAAMVGLSRRRAGTTSGLVITVDGEWLTIVAPGVGAGAARVSALVGELARPMGGELLPDDYGFRIPTLAALRRREGR